ncbi:MAG: Appr-1-p processing protein [Candidatus Woesearchaeota archaeon]
MKNKINYQKGDVITASKDVVKNNDNLNIIIPHICNNEGKWGKGFVKALSKEFPECERIYKRDIEYKINNNFSTLGTISICHSENYKIHIFNMIAQKLYVKTPIRYSALVECMNNINILIKNNGSEKKYKIYAPMFGSGLAGGNWEFIQRLIWEIWIEKYNLDVTIFQL